MLQLYLRHDTWGKLKILKWEGKNKGDSPCPTMLKKPDTFEVAMGPQTVCGKDCNSTGKMDQRWILKAKKNAVKSSAVGIFEKQVGRALFFFFFEVQVVLCCHYDLTRLSLFACVKDFSGKFALIFKLRTWINIHCFA